MKLYQVLGQIVICTGLIGCNNANPPTASDKPVEGTEQKVKANSNGKELEKKNDGLTYTVATESSFPPFALRDSHGLNSGYDVELIKAVADKQGFNIEIKTLPWGAWPETLNDDSIDIWISGIAITPERLDMVDFTDPYMSRETIAITLDTEDNKNITADNIKDYIVAVQKGTPDYDYVKEIKADSPDEVMPVKTNFLGINALATKQAEVLIGNDKVLTYLIKQHDGVKVRKIPLGVLKTDLAFTVKKGNNDLKMQLNEGLAKVKQDTATYNAINQKWFGQSEVN